MIYHYKVPQIPPSLNEFLGRENTWQYRELKQSWKNLIALYCRPRPDVPVEYAEVTLNYFFPTNIRRDPDNYSGKMLLDGLVSARIIKDDDFKHIRLILLSSGKDAKKPRVEITVKKLPSADTEVQ